MNEETERWFGEVFRRAYELQNQATNLLLDLRTVYDHLKYDHAVDPIQYTFVPPNKSSEELLQEMINGK